MYNNLFSRLTFTMKVGVSLEAIQKFGQLYNIQHEKELIICSPALNSILLVV